ncbi:hypothetical protein MKX03_036227 [Papaver bracteatum]|nr:hypothetical protein MKX03_036227 [Papaver bracteatum]
MGNMHAYAWLLLVQFLILILVGIATATKPSKISKPGCRESCGNVTIPFAFGLDHPGCYLGEAFRITCNDTFNPPSVHMKFSEYHVGYKVLQLELDFIRMSEYVSPIDYNKTTGKGQSIYVFKDDLTSQRPLSYSVTRNKLMAIGCDFFAYIPSQDSRNYKSGCASFCGNQTTVTPITSRNLSSCFGNGCCQARVPEGLGLTTYEFKVESLNTKNKSWILNPSSFAFMVEQKFSEFDKLFQNTSTIGFNVPVIRNWAIGNETCKVSQKNSSSFACGRNTYCVDSNPGYQCKCSPGFRGNPYLIDGCQDIDECKELVNDKHFCQNEASCKNIEGGYYCVCSKGYHGDGKVLGTGCTRDKNVPTIFIVSLGIAIGLLLVILFGISFWLYYRLGKRVQIITKKKHFKRNGGLLLEHQNSSYGSGVVKAQIFSIKELERITDCFNKSRVIGKGSFGEVYKGMLSDGRIVAIKKAKKVDETQLPAFINEIALLSQISHRHIVRLVGCCLEGEIPLLVYEFVPQGALSFHIHDQCDNESPISWKDRLRIASEIAHALVYLHTGASTPIFHKDIKPSNILLDENFRAKLADFGTSKAFPIGKTHLTTDVEGTFGYWDPEFCRLGHYTEKSDVFSFGVVLLELLTVRKALMNEEGIGEKSLVLYFESLMKDDRLFEIVDTRVLVEAGEPEVLGVAELAKRCVNAKGKKRPSMKEVARHLDEFRRIHEDILDDNDEKFQSEESRLLFDQKSWDTTATNDHVKAYDSLC